MSAVTQKTGAADEVVVDIFEKMADELRHQMIELDISYSMNDSFQAFTGLQGETKLTVAQALLREEAVRRDAIGPLFALAPFNTVVRTAMPLGGSLVDMHAAVDALEPAGGTSIVLAVDHGLEFLRLNPSQAGVNQLVIVTDAEDFYTITQCDAHVAQALADAIVVDIILISAHVGKSTAAGNLRLLSERTKGRFAMVTDAEGLRTAFREIAARPVFLLT